MTRQPIFLLDMLANGDIMKLPISVFKGTVTKRFYLRVKCHQISQHKQRLGTDSR